MLEAVDFSGWTSVPTPAQLACLQAMGARKAIIGTRGNRQFSPQAAACIAFGWSVEAYVFLYGFESGTAQGAAAVGVVRPFPQIRRMWLDVENDPARAVQPGPATWRQCVRDARAAVSMAGLVPGIYTSESKWQLTGNTTEHSDLDLWEARWRYPSGDPRGMFEPPLPFRPVIGGWSRRVMVQYAGDLTVCGLNVDLNDIEAVTVEDDEMKRANGVAKFFADNPDFGIGSYVMAIDQDFKAPDGSPLIPASAQRIRLELFLDRGVNQGALVFRDGSGGAYAGQVGDGYGTYRQIDVFIGRAPDNARIVRFDVAGKAIRFARPTAVGLLGYWA